MEVGRYWRKRQPNRDGKGHELFEAHYKKNEDNRRGSFTSASVIEKKEEYQPRTLDFSQESLFCLRAIYYIQIVIDMQVVTD
jgi:hypothetical protein